MLNLLGGLFGGNKGGNGATATAVARPVIADAPPAAPVVETSTPVEDPAEVKRRQEEEARVAAERAVAEERTRIQRERLPITGVAAQYARRHETRTPDAVRSDINATTAERDNLAEQHKKETAECLPIEVDLKNQLQHEQHRRTNAYNQQLNALKLELARAELDTAYDRIDMNFLRLRKWSDGHAEPVPLFAMFSHDCPHSCLVASSYYERGVRTEKYSIPHAFHQWCGVTLERLKPLSAENLQYSESRSAGVSAQFVGALPAAIRTVLKEAQPKFQNMYMVTEAPDWEVDLQPNWWSPSHHGNSYGKSKPVPPSKILLIGETQGIYWLLTTFETIPSNDFVQKAFAVNK